MPTVLPVVDRQDTCDRRVQVEDLGPDLGETRLGEHVAKPLSGPVRGGAGDPWLAGQRDASAGTKQVPQTAQPLHRIRPEPQGIDGKNGVERIVEARQLIHGAMT